MQLVKLYLFMVGYRDDHDRWMREMLYGKERNFIFISNSAQCDKKRKEIAEFVGLKLVKTFRYNNAGHSSLRWNELPPKPEWVSLSKKEYIESILKHHYSKNYLTFHAMEKR